MRFDFFATSLYRRDRRVVSSRNPPNIKHLKINLKTLEIISRATVKKERGANRVVVNNYVIPRDVSEINAKSAATLVS